MVELKASETVLATAVESWLSEPSDGRGSAGIGVFIEVSFGLTSWIFTGDMRITNCPLLVKESI